MSGTGDTVIWGVCVVNVDVSCLCVTGIWCVSFHRSVLVKGREGGVELVFTNSWSMLLTLARGAFFHVHRSLCFYDVPVSCLGVQEGGSCR